MGICNTCKRAIESGKEDDHNHVIQSANIYDDETLSFVISLQRCYDNTAAIARQLARARRELKDFFPEKKFEIQPARMMMVRNRRSEKSPILGESFVAAHVAFEV